MDKWKLDMEEGGGGCQLERSVPVGILLVIHLKRISAHFYDPESSECPFLKPGQVEVCFKWLLLYF